MIQTAAPIAAVSAAIKYYVAGDIIVLAVMFVLFYLLVEMRPTHNINNKILMWMVLSTALASASNIIMHSLLDDFAPWKRVFIYAGRVGYHLGLFLEVALLIIFLTRYVSLDEKHCILYERLSVIGLVFGAALEIFGMVFGFGFQVNDSGRVTSTFNFFSVSYLYFVGIFLYILFKYQNRIVVQVMHGAMFSVMLSIVILGLQGKYHNNSFTAAAFMLPLIAMMFLIHPNPYNLVTGTVNEAVFKRIIEDARERGKKMILLLLELNDTDVLSKIPRDEQLRLFHFADEYVNGGLLCELDAGEYVLVFPAERNPELEKSIGNAVTGFRKLYQRFGISYKIIVMPTRDEILNSADYIRILRKIEQTIPANTVYRVEENDIKRSIEDQFILDQLEQIVHTMNLNDERVLVYCQPVYNVEDKRFDTAEALMRITLPEKGFIYPDQFIPIAEEHGMIHDLSLIILNKTCIAIKKLMDEGYKVSRVSVNFSIMEVRSDFFVDDIINIIEINHIPFDKIAIELTETRNATDFELLKPKINTLKSHGMKFYLDDFGTGYSNFDRIMELPIDIIKFDRSLVIEAAKNKNHELMIYTFAQMFRELGYHVLYEGVEDEADEDLCIRMHAQYLQGYKYSRPMPIEELREFFERSSSNPPLQAQ